MSSHETIRIYWIRHGFSIANMYKTLGQTYRQSTTLDPHLTNYALWYSILTGKKLLEQIGRKTITCVYSSYMKRAIETAVWMFWASGCRLFYQLPYISEQNHKMVDLVGPYLRLGDDNRMDHIDSSVYVPAVWKRKHTRNQHNKRTRSQRGSGKRTIHQRGHHTRTRSHRGIMNHKRMNTPNKMNMYHNMRVHISRISDASNTNKELPDWNAFQKFIIQNCNRLQPSFTDDDKVPCFIIVSHSHFLQHNVDGIEHIANNQCYEVDYKVDKKQTILIEETKSKTFDLHEKRCDLNRDEIDVERETNAALDVPHPLLKQQFRNTTIQPIQTYKVQNIITFDTE